MGSQSLIDTKLLKFFEQKATNYEENPQRYFHKNKCIDFAKIGDVLIEANDASEKLTVLESNKYEDYLQCYHKLLPIFQHSLEVLEDTSLQTLQLQWLGSNIAYLDVHLEDEKNLLKTHTVELLLRLTAVLEFSLGNVYYTQTNGRTPPHLLRDLLSTTELREIFGFDAILFLKIVLGTPNSINLRNIVWHGFPQPQEIPAYYVTVLLLSMHTLGTSLQNRQFHIKQRKQITDFDFFIEKLSPHFPSLTALDIEELRQKVVLSHPFLPEQYKPFWLQLLHWYEREKYSNLVILILPQIELLLRLIYARANGYDISAKLDEYYITLDTIFEAEVPVMESSPSRKNKVLIEKAGISASALHGLYDIFVTPNGPRLRDKVSHGEVCLEALQNRRLCDFLLYISLNLLTFEKDTFSAFHYKSIFHLNALAAAAIRCAHQQLQLFRQKDDFQIMKQTEFPNSLCSNVNQANIEIFQRSKNEPELMNLVIRISELIAQTCNNYEASLELKLKLLEERELHSKRRRTLERVIETLPEIFQVLCGIIECLQIVFVKAQSHMETIYTDAGTFKNLLRCLKHVLKISENFVKYSDKDSNEWIKALELCKQFETCRERLFAQNLYAEFCSRS